MPPSKGANFERNYFHTLLPQRHHYDIMIADADFEFRGQWACYTSIIATFVSQTIKALSLKQRRRPKKGAKMCGIVNPKFDISWLLITPKRIPLCPRLKLVLLISLNNVLNEMLQELQTNKRYGLQSLAYRHSQSGFNSNLKSSFSMTVVLHRNLKWNSLNFSYVFRGCFNWSEDRLPRVLVHSYHLIPSFNTSLFFCVRLVNKDASKPFWISF